MAVQNGGPDIPLKVVPVHELIFDHLKKHDPEGTCMISAETGKVFTFRLFTHMTISAANYLHHRGVRKGDVVAVVLPNCPEFASCLLATFADGAVATGLSPAFTADELTRYFKDSGSRFVITRSAVFHKVYEASSAPDSSVQEILTVDPCDFGENGGAIRMSQMNFDCDGERLEASVQFDCKKDLCICPFSSGTTLVPKAAKLSHYNLVSMVQILDQAEKITLPTKGFNIICFLPWYHIYGTVIFLVGLVRGFVMITMEDFKSELFLNLIQTYKTEFLFVVPPILSFLVRHPLVKKYDITSVRTILVAAAPFGKEESQRVTETHPHVKYIRQAYGLTEISGASHIMPAIPVSELRHGSCGVLLPNFECKVVDVETGTVLHAGERGELCLRGPACCLGYLGNEGATEKLIDSEGWLYTGDVGYFDKDGFYYIVDRIKDMIKIKGFQVAPAEVEDVLVKSDLVMDAAVYGIPDERDGEAIVVIAVKKPNSTVTRKDIVNYMKTNLTEYKVAKEQNVMFAASIPKTATGKILRKVIKTPEFLSQTHTC